ncbi:pollen-specific leucine-rich repeat extensin-like protein 1 [Ctenocephalides felis]|uniref:pollen-specific leucine-rich repeat extensin-like protein 1 n=1 Tax=Ctenocephalides felis TaxID=7515 RepID=UPI000E6E19E9|nr:pollen-specific leucine-rich repeat extensin-like protein 1 [Ctenocephalides felis]
MASTYTTENLCPSKWLMLFACCAVLLQAEARRIRISRPRPVERADSEEESVSAEQESIAPRVRYYAAEAQETQSPRSLVLVSTEESYNGLYGQQSSGRADNYVSPRSQLIKVAKQKEPTKAPPVQTIRNYNKVNDDGSFTFGYEAADGSFKEETRGTDCVVRGKYGYVDPDGNKREFTYVSGNPCDPNAQSAEEEEEKSEEESEENVPPNYPSRPVRPLQVRPLHLRPTPAPVRPTTTVFQNIYDQNSSSEEEEDYEQPAPAPAPAPVHIARPAPPVHIQAAPAPIHIPQPPAPIHITAPSPTAIPIRTRLTPRPNYISSERPLLERHRPKVTPTSNTVYYQPQSIEITPRPQSHSPAQTLQTQPPATTYRPTLLSVTARPSSAYTRPATAPSLNAVGTRGQIDFAAEFAKFQQENNIISSTPSDLPKSLKPTSKAPPSSSSSVSGNPVYSSQLLFDPSSGQYDTSLFQTLPQTEGEFTLNHRIQPYVHQPQHAAPPRLVSISQLQPQTRPQPSPLFRHQIQHSDAVPINFPQQAFQQQQNEVQFQNSQQLFAQQQQLQHNQLQRDRMEAARAAYYFVQPSSQGSQQNPSGQIESFLRGHNIQF